MRIVADIRTEKIVVIRVCCEVVKRGTKLPPTTKTFLRSYLVIQKKKSKTFTTSKIIQNVTNYFHS